MGKKLRHLLLATLEDPFNPASWSGTPYNMRLALERRLEKLSILGNIKPKRTLGNVALRALLGGKPPRYPLYLTGAAQKDFAQKTRAALDHLKPDAMLAISTHCIVRLPKPEVPVFMFSDAPWLSYRETYRDFDRMPLLGPRFARLDADAARRCTGLIFGSDWAAREAERLYGVERSSLHVQPLGANWTPDVSSDALKAIVEARPVDRLDLLFVGKDWERKGGPLAVQIASGLKAAGVTNVCLHIVGCNPAIPSGAQDFVRIHGLLRSSNPEQSAQLRDLFFKSHFLVVPTRAECYGLVFAEAQAFALPVVSCAIQSLPSIVLDKETGILEPKGAPADAFVRRILPLVRNRDAYLRMACNARSRYETDLNWDNFAEGIIQTIEQAC